MAVYTLYDENGEYLDSCNAQNEEDAIDQFLDTWDITDDMVIEKTWDE